LGISQPAQPNTAPAALNLSTTSAHASNPARASAQATPPVRAAGLPDLEPDSVRDSDGRAVAAFAAQHSAAAAPDAASEAQRSATAALLENRNALPPTGYGKPAAEQPATLSILA
jgi:hypothetical protein